MSTALESFEDHYDPYHPEWSEKMWDVVEHLHARCPVVHSDSALSAGATKVWQSVGNCPEQGIRIEQSA